MTIKCLGTAKLKKSETGEIFEVCPNDLEWEVVDVEEKKMGAELHYSAQLFFYSKQKELEAEVIWDVWEYPIGSINHQEIQLENCQILKNFDDFLSESIL